MSKFFTAIFVLCMLSAFNCARLQGSKSTNTTITKFDQIANAMTSNLTEILHSFEGSFSKNITMEERKEVYVSLEKQFHHLMKWATNAGKGMEKFFHEASEEEKSHMKKAMKNVTDLVHKIIRLGDEKEREIFNRPSFAQSKRGKGPRRGGKGKGKGKGKGPRRGPKIGDDEEFRNATEEFEPRHGNSTDEFEPRHGNSTHDDEFEPRHGNSTHDHEFEPRHGNSTHDHEFEPRHGNSTHDHEFEPRHGNSTHDHEFVNGTFTHDHEFEHGNFTHDHDFEHGNHTHDHDFEHGNHTHDHDFEHGDHTHDHDFEDEEPQNMFEQ